ncbi:hypothetical protein KXD40_008018 [Peronospora effusa]|nr:hypothetical protein KXD40_008018 [Peronospora effusa]CAI5700777.1 unnamed protein product [Peronospora effusa]
MTLNMIMLLVSLMTSSFLLFILSRLSITTFNFSFLSLTFFSLLPMFVSIDIVTSNWGWGLFTQAWKSIIRNSDSQPTTDKIISDDALIVLRNEFLETINGRYLHSIKTSRKTRRLDQKTHRPEILSSSTSGSSLYEQVHGTLQDHAFNRTAPVYFVDLVTGSFLRATQHRKLVLTSEPNTLCLFHLERGKTHHWGFRSVVTQRYIGQNLVQRMVVASKKLHAWESFRVLQRPQDKGNGACSPQVYLILGASRFGKGMWLANKSGSRSFAHPVVPTNRNNNLNQETEEESETEHDRRNRKASRQRSLFLSKQFDQAIGFVYSSDLSALMAAAAEAKLQRESSSASRAFARAQTAPPVIEGAVQTKGTRFQAPLLARWNLCDVRLPWLEAVADTYSNSDQTPSFLEIPKGEMIELTTTTIPGLNVNTFLEMVAPRATRLKCKVGRSLLAQSAPVGISATAASKRRTSSEKRRSADLLLDWHAHPHFGLVRALSYRSDAGALSSQLDSDTRVAKSAASKNMKAVTIEQYHSCMVDDGLLDDVTENELHTPDKAVLRLKIYTLSIPYSNCFSIEVLVDVEDVPVYQDDAVNDATSTAFFDKRIDKCNSALKIRWRAGVIFSRNTMFKAQIERGALDGVRCGCASILKLLRDKDTRQHFATPVVRRGSVVDTDCPFSAPNTDIATALAANDNLESSSSRGPQKKLRVKPDLAFLPRAFALEIGKGLMSAITDTSLLSNNLSTLPTQLPWRPYSGGQLSTLGFVPPHNVITTTATPFFESVPEGFVQVLEENMGSKVTASLFFEALLSNACSFFRPAQADGGNMEVDISAWHAILSPRQSRNRTKGYIRKQVFRMLLSGIPGVQVAEVEDYQYYALVKARTQDSLTSTSDHGTDSNQGDKQGSFVQNASGSQSSMGRDQTRPLSGLTKDAEALEMKPRRIKSQRLEFGMKLFVPALPEGSNYSIEVLAIVEPADDYSSDNVLRVFFASPVRHQQSEMRGNALVNPHVVAGVLRGLKQIWKRVAQTMVEICEVNNDDVVLFNQRQQTTLQGLNEQEMYLPQRSRMNSNLPTHDELASKLIEAIAAMYG